MVLILRLFGVCVLLILHLLEVMWINNAINAGSVFSINISPYSFLISFMRVVQAPKEHYTSWAVLRQCWQ